MTLRQYLIIMGFGTILCAAALGLILFQIDPYQADIISFGLFYACVCFTLIGLCSLLILPVIQALSKRRNMLLHKHVTKSLRIAITVSFFLTLLLFLQGEQLLSPITGAALFTFMALVIVIRISMHKHSSFSP